METDVSKTLILNAKHQCRWAVYRQRFDFPETLPFNPSGFRAAVNDATEIFNRLWYKTMDHAALRKQAYALLILVSAGLMLGRIIAIDRVDTYLLERNRLAQIPGILKQKQERLEKENRDPEAIHEELKRTEAELYRHASLASPMLSANDRSRWCTIRALVEPGMRVVRPVGDGTRYQTVWYAIDRVQNEKGWDTIDMVKHTLPDDPNGPGYLYSSKPPLLVTLMALPYAILYHGSGGVLSFETQLYPVVRIMLVLINLLPLLAAWVVACRLIERFGTTDWGRLFTVATLCFGTFLSTFAVTLNNHLPAFVCTCFALYSTVRLVDGTKHPIRHAFSAACFASMLVACELPGIFFTVPLMLFLLARRPRLTLACCLPVCLLAASAFMAANYAAHGTIVPPYAFKGGAEENWYSYTYEREGRLRQSYWDNPVGVDRGEPSYAVYAFNMIFGHHGIFSLTPVWLLSAGGIVLILIRGRNERLWRFALFTLTLTSVIFVFYLLRNQENRNYGGVASGLRWTFWLVPLWLILLQPMADRLAKYRLGRASAGLLLLFSCLSAAYPSWNPWTMPWLYHLLRFFGIMTI